MTRMNITGLSAPCVALTLCMAMVSGFQNTIAAETEATTWEIEIDAFSGRPNPVFKLEEAEITHVKALISQAKTSTQVKSKAKVFPPNRSYGGMLLRRMGTDKAIQSELRVRGKNLLEESGTNQTWRSADDTALELYLADLAVQKGMIDQKARQIIGEEVEKAAKENN
jgi:hypothetical protein